MLPSNAAKPPTAAVAVAKREEGKLVRAETNNNEISKDFDDDDEDVRGCNRGTPIQEFYTGQKIFITGATGFLGKVLVEKLLRSCPEISLIYLLVRSKRDKNAQSRVDELLQNEIFDRVKQLVPNFREKIVGINGDCAVEGLGLSDVDRKLLEREVSIVFHVAATIRFKEELKLATAINVQSTDSILEMCKRMEKLKSFVHVSTAYANCHLSEIKERFYEYPITYKQLLTLVNTLSESTLSEIAHKLIRPWPNTYTFTKAIAEDLVRRKCQELPMGIFRPAIGVVSIAWQIFKALGIFLLTLLGRMILFFCAIIYTVARPRRRTNQSNQNQQEPFQTMYPEDYPNFEEDFATMMISTADEPLLGWVDNMHGATGLTAGVLSGVLRVVRCDPNCTANLVPVDMTVNAMIACAWDISVQKSRRREDMLIYNYVSSAEARITWSDYRSNNYEYTDAYPLNSSAWYLELIYIKNSLLYHICWTLIHLLPAVIVDTATICVGQKPRLWKMYKRIYTAVDMIAPFSTMEWEHTNDNVQEMWLRLSKKDQQLFKFNMRNFDWKKYFANYIKGLRLYLFKENPNTLPESRIKWRRLYWMHQALKTILLLGAGWILWSTCIRLFL